jgi:hypothetical protein
MLAAFSLVDRASQPAAVNPWSKICSTDRRRVNQWIALVSRSILKWRYFFPRIPLAHSA